MNLKGKRESKGNLQFALRILPQLLQYSSHLLQLFLKSHPRLIIRPLIERNIDGALGLARFVSGVIIQSLRKELDVQGRLHKRWQRIFGTGLEGLNQCTGELLQEMLEDLRCERSNGGGDF